jgi:hypothetical protein
LARLELGEGIDGRIESLADSELILEVCLQGASELMVTPEELSSRHGHRFYHLSVVDRTDRISAHLLSELSKERSIRGTFVRRVRERMEAAPSSEESQLYYQALLKGLSAFSEVKK